MLFSILYWDHFWVYEVYDIMNLLKVFGLHIVIVVILITCTTKNHAGELLSVSATHDRPVKPAAYIFNLQFDLPVTSTSQIEITFAEQFTLLQNVIASSDDLSGGLLAKVDRQKLILQRVKAQQDIAAGNRIEIRAASIINPVDMEKSYDFSVLLLTGNSIVDSVRTSVNIELFTNPKLQ